MFIQQAFINPAVYLGLCRLWVYRGNAVVSLLGPRSPSMKDSARATQFRESETRWGGMGLRVGRGESWPPCGEASGWAQVFLLELNCPVGISPEDAVNFPFLSRCAARSLWSKPASSHQPYQLVTVLPGRSSCNFGFKVSLFKPPQHKSHLWEAKARPPDRWNRDPASPSPTPPPQD